MSPNVVEALFVVFIALTMLDSVAFYAFWPWAYLAGPRILAVEVPELSRPCAVTARSFNTEHGAFRSSDERVYLRSRLLFFDPGRAQSVVGVIRWDGGSAVLEARLQLSYVAFLLVWASLWVAALLVSALSGQSSQFDLGLFLIGLAIFVFITVFTVAVGRARMRLLLTEYQRKWSSGVDPSHV